MSVEQPAAMSWWEARTDRTGKITGEEWAAQFGVIPELIPFQHRSYDPLEVVITARRRINELPPTAAVLKPAQLLRDSPTDPSVPTGLELLFRAAGSWPTGRTGSKSHHYANPDYVHLGSVDWTITDPRERIDELRRCASLGTLSKRDVAARFGVTTVGGVTAWLRRRDIPWSEWRAWGKCRIARTAQVIHDWGRWGHSEIAEAFGLPVRTLYGYRRRWVIESNWTVPEDPSADTRFASGHLPPEVNDGV